jgi:AcrR family transcriptional regulator
MSSTRIVTTMSAVKSPSGGRREQAAATRERVIRAADRVFGERGYTGARMADIAKEAGVAVQTVYFVFHTKSELLAACFEFLVLGPDRLPPAKQPFWDRTMKATTGRRALREFAAGNGEIVARVAAIDGVARAARHEPEAVEVQSNAEELRRAGYRRLVEHLADRFGLRAGLDVETATDTLLLLGGGPTYLTLTGYGWAHEQYVEFVADAAALQLLAQPGRPT